MDGATRVMPIETIHGDFRRYYEGVRDAVLGKAEPPVKAVEAWRTARLLEFAGESSEKRCEVICDWSGEPR